MDAWIIWLIAACVLLGLEVLTQAVWALCFAVGCLLALILSLVTESPVVSLIAVGAGALLSWILIAPFVRRWEQSRSKSTRTGMDALLGRRAMVTEEVKPGQTGRAQIDGDNWQVTAPGTEHCIKPGHEVVVTGYDSIILTVKPLESK